VWSLLHPDPQLGRQIAIFFLGCVAVAGVVGAATVSKRIFFVQALPALLGLALALLAA
jgi:putative membrane protein